MPIIGQKKREKIQEQILFYIYNIFPKQVFTSQIAQELARDEEFTKNLMEELFKKQLVIKIDKNPKGIKYLRRLRWRLSNKVHQTYNQQM